MNIFYLHEDVKTCAMMHNDKHCVKMIIEYAQLLSTAHRVLDGEEYYDRTANNRRIKRWRMSDDIMENGLMKASHVNHPSNKWLRKSKANYECCLRCGVICLMNILIDMVRFINVLRDMNISKIHQRIFQIDHLLLRLMI